jgi:hypothetical protein
MRLRICLSDKHGTIDLARQNFTSSVPTFCLQKFLSWQRYRLRGGRVLPYGGHIHHLVYTMQLLSLFNLFDVHNVTQSELCRKSFEGQTDNEFIVIAQRRRRPPATVHLPSKTFEIIHGALYAPAIGHNARLMLELRILPRYDGACSNVDPASCSTSDWRTLLTFRVVSCTCIYMANKNLE